LRYKVKLSGCRNGEKPRDTRLLFVAFEPHDKSDTKAGEDEGPVTFRPHIGGDQRRDHHDPDEEDTEELAVEMAAQLFPKNYKKYVNT